MISSAAGAGRDIAAHGLRGPRSTRVNGSVPWIMFTFIMHTNAAPQPREEVGVLDPEHRAQDHLERDVLHPRRSGERPAERPGLELARRDVGDHVAIPRDAAPVEGREHQLAHAQVVAPSSSRTERGRGSAP